MTTKELLAEKERLEATVQELERRIYVEEIGEGRITVSGHTFINESTHRAICGELERERDELLARAYQFDNKPHLLFSYLMQMASDPETKRLMDEAYQSVGKWKELEREVARLKGYAQHTGDCELNTANDQASKANAPVHCYWLRLGRDIMELRDVMASHWRGARRAPACTCGLNAHTELA